MSCAPTVRSRSMFFERVCSECALGMSALGERSRVRSRFLQRALSAQVLSLRGLSLGRLSVATPGLLNQAPRWGPAVRVAIVGSRGTKGPLPGGPLGASGRVPHGGQDPCRTWLQRYCKPVRTFWTRPVGGLSLCAPLGELASG